MPFDALRRVLQNNTPGLEIIADPVGQREVFDLAGLLTLLNQCLDLGIQSLVPPVIQYTQHIGKSIKKRAGIPQRGGCARFGDIGVDITGQLKQ